MKKLLLIIICLLFTLSSCYITETIPTYDGQIAYKESIKKRNTQKKSYKKYHRQENRRIKRLQNANAKNYN